MLGWPLVWDENEQTAVQSPLGGTKISWDAWGGPEVEPKKGRNRQRFDLVSADPASEAERLISLGAIRLTTCLTVSSLPTPTPTSSACTAGTLTATTAWETVAVGSGRPPTNGDQMDR